MQESIHDRLRQARIRKGLRTAKDAAVLLDTPYGTYAGHENGSRGIKLEELITYSAAFGVNPSWLLFGDSRPDLMHQTQSTFTRVADGNPDVWIYRAETDDYAPFVKAGDRIRVSPQDDRAEWVEDRVLAQDEFGRMRLGVLCPAEHGAYRFVDLVKGFVGVFPIVWAAKLISVEFER